MAAKCRLSKVEGLERRTASTAALAVATAASAMATAMSCLSSASEMFAVVVMVLTSRCCVIVS